MMRPKLIVLVVLSVIVLILVVQNAETVTVRLLFWEFSMSRVILILLTAAAGFAGGYVVARLGGRERPPRPL